jgi:hypothetical protein
VIVVDADIEHFRTFGFVVLRGALEAAQLSEEMDRSFADGLRSSFEAEVGGRVLSAAYLPMMCETTPVSLALLDHFAGPAAQLLGSPVLPVRAKGVIYFGAAAWHNDSDRDVASIGFLAYLEPLDVDNGALRLIPGSHRREFGDALRTYLAVSTSTLPGHVVPTTPGDVIVFDEHLYHASTGGRNRRQWRVDYLQDPVGPGDEEKVRSYFSGLYRPDWDGGYDVDRYPSYGAAWRASGRPWVDRLDELGAYDKAEREEAFARSQRR